MILASTTPGNLILSVLAAAAYAWPAVRAMHMGHGAARAFCDLLLVASGHYAALLREYTE